MAYDLSKLTTIQIEWGSRMIADQTDSMLVTRLMAVILADTKTLLAAKKNIDALDPFIEQAAGIPYEDSQKAAEDFFERWRTFQMRILRSAAGPEAEIPGMPKPATLMLSAAAQATVEGGTATP